MLGRIDTPQQFIIMPSIRTIIALPVILLLVCCGTSTQEHNKRYQKEKAENARQDSLAFKVAVLPTLDCLPIFVAVESGIYSSMGVDIRLKEKTAQMDCDEAFVQGKVECMCSDLMRTERLRQKGIGIDYITSTNAYWQLLGNSKGRIQEIKHLGDKMVGMSRYSGTDYFSTLAIDSVKISLPVFRVQVNDVTVRMMMLLNNEIDAAVLTEPQATAARMQKHTVLADTRHKDIQLGVIAARNRLAGDPYREKQMDAFVKGYDMACDSINEKGIAYYSAVIKKYYDIAPSVMESLPHLNYHHAIPPRQKDIDRTRNVKWRTF